MTPLEVVQEFIDRINRHDVKGLCDLMTEDHVFIDSLGVRVQGREEMRKGWIQYYYLVPDYEIVCKEMIAHGATVGGFGLARGTYAAGGKIIKENSWEMPAAWRALIRQERIAEWQVYADNEPVRKFLEKR